MRSKSPIVLSSSVASSLSLQLKNYVVGGCPGFLALLFFLPPDGSMGNMIVALASGIVAVVVAFIACTVILKKAYKEDV